MSNHQPTRATEMRLPSPIAASVEPCPPRRTASVLAPPEYPPRAPSRSLKLSRDLRGIPVDRYRLPSDGRKWKVIARERMALAEWLSTYGDGDGSRIFPSVESMARAYCTTQLSY
jgi:hypothetical protein